MSKRLEVVRFYFEGLSYDEIVKRTGVAKKSRIVPIRSCPMLATPSTGVNVTAKMT